uniref:Neuraminidase n=1 Tax=Newt influenza virus TaxID=2982031 RepID=A0A9N7ABC5_9ORTO|nr:TPA_asm: neuraminidase [Newt influenza virus]
MHITNNHVFILHALSAGVLFAISVANFSITIYELLGTSSEQLQCNNTTVIYNQSIPERGPQLCNVSLKCPELPTKNYHISKPTCEGNRWSPIFQTWTSKYAATGARTLNNRPPTAVSLKDGIAGISLDHSTSTPTPTSDTAVDQSDFRSLFIWPIGSYPGGEGTKKICKAWGSFACFDGIEDTMGCITGPGNAAVLTILYGGKPADRMETYAFDVFRTMESQCVCHNGTCAAMVTDGNYAIESRAKMIFMKKGKVIKTSPIEGPGSKMIEECSCINYDERAFRCLCRDNRENSRRPFVICSWESLTCNAEYLCSGTQLDCPRELDQERPCGGEFGTLVGGVKGAYLPVGKTRQCATRTVGRTTRVGMELLCTNDDFATSSAMMTKIGDLVTPTIETGYSSGFTIYNEEKDCNTICVTTEMIFRGTKGTSADLTVHCLMAGDSSPMRVDRATIDRSSFSSLL